MIVTGLTGGIATGKSTVGRLLAVEFGIPVLDADQHAREVVGTDSPALKAIVEAFGSDVLTDEGTLDRAHMRVLISANANARQVLEGITHPAIRQSMAQRLTSLATDGTSHAVVEAALLVETGSYRGYPNLIVVTCAPTTQLTRLMARDGMTPEAAQALIAAQLPLADKEVVATHLIRNDGTLDALRTQIYSVWADIVGQ